jgi:hypothetical protein
MKLSQDQVNTILKNAPANVDKKVILDGLITRGYELEGVDTNAVKQRLNNTASSTPVMPTKVPQAETATDKSPGFLSREVGILDNRFGAALNDFKGTSEESKGEPLPVRIAQGVGSATGIIPDTIVNAAQGVGDLFGYEKGKGLKGVDELKNSLAIKNEVSKFDFNQSADKIVEFLGKINRSVGTMTPEQIANEKTIGDQLIQLSKTHPDIASTIESTLKGASGAGEVVDNLLIVDGVSTAVKPIVKAGAKAAVNTVDAIASIGGGGGTGASMVTDAVKAGADLRNNIQLTIASKNVNPQLASSAKRLFLDGTKNIKDPIATYDSYLAQSKKALGDIKADPAISVVGEKMGTAFDNVLKQRSAVGKVLGDELKANGKIKINITEPKASLLSDLKDSGLSYNPKTNQLTSFQGSKFAPDEVSMLNDFAKDVTALGDNPTVSQIDNFVSKTRSKLQFTKGKAGVTGTTNAERIINNGIAKIKGTLDPAVNGNSSLSGYWKANNTYSELSDFVDEGSSFLGKKTLSGDYAKDASVAKSSVQSILNQGKKDFMIKLEALTGYNAIDDAVLALQAMKDAGDFRGLSLLQAMSETGIPTSTSGFTQKVVDFAVKKGGELLAGTPEEQTRAFIQDLLTKNKKVRKVTPKK